MNKLLTLLLILPAASFAEEYTHILQPGEIKSFSIKADSSKIVKSRIMETDLDKFQKECSNKNCISMTDTSNELSKQTLESSYGVSKEMTPNSDGLIKFNVTHSYPNKINVRVQVFKDWEDLMEKQKNI